MSGEVRPLDEECVRLDRRCKALKRQVGALKQQVGAMKEQAEELKLSLWAANRLIDDYGVLRGTAEATFPDLCDRVWRIAPDARPSQVRVGVERRRAVLLCWFGAVDAIGDKAWPQMTSRERPMVDAMIVTASLRWLMTRGAMVNTRDLPLNRRPVVVVRGLHWGAESEDYTTALLLAVEMAHRDMVTRERWAAEAGELRQ